MEIDKLLRIYESSGKLKQFHLLKDIIAYYEIKDDDKVLEYFEKMLRLTKQFLAFDENPDESIKDILAETFQITFSYIQNFERLDLFQMYLPAYTEYESLLSSPIPKAKILQTFGFFYWLDHQFDKSIEALKASLKLINAYGSVTDIPNRYTNLGFIYEDTGNYAMADKYYKEALSFAKSNNSHKALFMAYAALGRLKSCQGRHEEAVLFFNEAIALSDNEDEDTLSVKCNLANSLFLLKKPTESLKLYNEMKRVETKKKYPSLYYTVLLNMANIYMQNKHLNEAFELLTETVKYADESGNKELQAGAEVNIALILNSQNNYEKAEQHILKTLEIGESSNNQRLINNSLFIQADILMKKKAFRQALECLKKCKKYIEKENNQERSKILYKNIGDCYGNIQDFKAAWQAANKCIKICEKISKDTQKEIDLANSNQVVHNRVEGFYFFKENDTFISRELSIKIGSPIIGRSKKLENCINQTILAANSDYANVLITGESGTGKELLARLLHFCSQRKNEQFIAINSALFSNSLAQSSIFGHTKGAFTGAVSNQAGFLELANKGTLFLDEIGDMPMDIQTAFLRVIEEKKIMSLGSDKYKNVDFRLVSATHQDIESMTENMTFRRDLFNRINTVQIHLPPLRERKEDIPLIINYLLIELCTKLNKKVPELSSQAINYLCDYDYLGNIRELNNMMQRLLLFNNKLKISLEDIYEVIPQKVSPDSNQILSNMNLAEMEKSLISQAMIKCNNVQVDASKLLGISSYTLNRKLKKLR